MTRFERCFMCALLLIPGRSAHAQLPEKITRDSVTALLSVMSYGVPTSPAFALLPNQADEVTHIYTGADLAANAKAWFQGSKLETGFALDYRPASAVGTLAQYRASGVRQLAFRSILSAGTASASEGSSDVLLAAGIRIPIIDRGDLRLDTLYEQALDDVLLRRLTACKPAGMTENAATADSVCKSFSTNDSVNAVITRFTAASWNAFRVNLGFAGALNVPNGNFDLDSVAAGQRGVWFGTSHPLGSKAQLNTIAKWSRAPTDSATDEKQRFVTGARLRWVAGSTALSIEGAYTNAAFQADSLDDDWLHVAAVAEFSLSGFGGMFKDQWVAIAYGGDRGRSADPGRRLTFRYALYKQRVIQR